jgi:release factor glutamine methyltransferase
MPEQIENVRPTHHVSMQAWRSWLARTFRDHGIVSAATDARLLLMHACGLSHAGLIGSSDRVLTERECVRLQDMTERRLAGEPVSRIVGTREFHELDFVLSAETLDPRADSEVLVDTVLEVTRRTRPADQPLSILDLGTGSGCLLVTLLHELPDATGLGIDISHGALLTARTNAQRLGVSPRARFVCADWLKGIGGSFDIVVVNPPYVARDEIARLAPEVRLHDPHRALDGGADGLGAYRAILPSVGDVLKPGGLLALEAGFGQSGRVEDMLERLGFAPGGAADRFGVNDLAGVERVIVARRPDASAPQKNSWNMRPIALA